MAVQPAVTVQPGVYCSLEGHRMEPWGSGVFDCCDDMGICCLGLWCPPCLMCRTSKELGEGLCLPLVDICFPATVSPVALALRVAMRERNRIQGSVFDDCCMVTWCTLCVWCQMAREIRNRRRTIINNTQINIYPMPPHYPPPMVVPTQNQYPPPMVVPTQPQGPPSMVVPTHVSVYPSCEK
ncbi:hypothetical protein ACEWY4_024789 [Coilia grayii]|uniref:Uncharacterized protein n=1 Tax=Coilia grayii TaxID=363190 RepID=A0ABD1IXS4_9TELE